MIIELLLALDVSVGLGYDLKNNDELESENVKGIVQIEKIVGNYSFGYWHSSQIDNGFRVSDDDKNIFYVKRYFRF